MKALILESYNTSYLLKEVETPVAAKGQVLVNIKASGVNPLDLKIRAGQAAHARTQLPAILGLDMAGVVAAVGEGVTRFKPGDEVYGITGGVAGIPGTLAEYAAVDADLLAMKPANLTMREAAAVPLVFITAWEGLVDRARVQEGQTVLVHGGAGGVGHVAVQLAKAHGAKVYTTVSPAKRALVESYGAIAIDYTALSAQDYIQGYTNGEGFDVVFDTLGGVTLDSSFLSAKRYTGHVVSALGWGSHSLAPLSFRGATYSGIFTLYPLISGRGRAHHGDILRQATALIEAGKLRPLTDGQPYTMESIADAYTAIEQGTARGKVVIDIAFSGLKK
ncbi:zinc-dependent alcohol dehydrogenase family protein [Flavitalea sp. BT771]|uniref:zinc-dependent alcohol dehydrogenase family protein n=1 Tax=Flavitalea sp. BT771 TaxID=3063329 RepID=UPI0026E22A68|nr:zinc-dependent alcohol dehydrogenase family protein [Flavitalea sp. BT771]MDO6430821.1 zinc-dependent alcohol dehydrogenase family protein [Flavitalea sp. BT771]MDV6219039.1 zinc-dependent alcohol dehydrogenase family protein [Flavitalea sp. BT771]